MVCVPTIIVNISMQVCEIYFSQENPHCNIQLLQSCIDDFSSPGFHPELLKLKPFRLLVQTEWNFYKEVM